MPTAIRDIELAAPSRILDDLAGYLRCMVVLRWCGRPIGRVFAPVSDGRVELSRLVDWLTPRERRDLCRSWVEAAVGSDRREATGFHPPAATVAICTRERPDDLRRALVGVLALNPAPAEVLVVDNDPSSDRTRALASSFPHVQYIREPRRGLNAARNRALREARGEVVAFLDDDVVPEAAWLGELLLNFGDPEVLCATGLTLPIELETEAQEQFEDHCSFSRGFRRRVFDGQHDSPLAVNHAGAGASMAVRRDLPARIGLFDDRLDAGTPTKSGGDHEMFARILLAGYRIAYDPSAVSWHRHRRTREELLETVEGYGVGVYAMWTGLLLERREIGVLKLAWGWFRSDQLGLLLRRLTGKRRTPHEELLAAEFAGCLQGARAWRASRRLRGAQPGTP